jgi:glycosyltransferase involved in cell wall biosynthesis
MQPRVAVFSARFLPYSETFVHDELRAHTRYEAHVFCTRRAHADRFPYPHVFAGGALYACTRISPRFDRQLAEGGYSLVHAHFGTGGVYAVPFARRHGLPLVVTFHGFDVPLLGSAERLYPKYWPYAALGPSVLRHMALGLCASNELYELLRELGVEPARLRVHRIGLDLERFVAAPRDPAAEPLVVMIGRFVPKKGLVYGVRAFAEVRRRLGRGRLVLVGDGELRRAIEAEIRAEGAEAHVSLAGTLPHAEVAALLARADVLLAPSVTSIDGDRESGNVAIKEASASGAVPIGTWHGGLPEIIDDGRTGFLVPERDVATLAARLETLLRDPDLRARMAEAARAKMHAEYDNRARVAALEEAYDSVARAPAARSA